jgi:WD40 repeat protein
VNGNITAEISLRRGTSRRGTKTILLEDGDELQFSPSKHEKLTYKFVTISAVDASPSSLGMQVERSPKSVRRYKGRDHSAFAVALGVGLPKITTKLHLRKKGILGLLSLPRSILIYIVQFLSCISIQRTMSYRIGKKSHSKDVTSSSISHDGAFIVTSSTDKTVRLWRAFDGKLLRTFEVGCSVMTVAFSPVNNNVFLCGAWNGTVLMWDCTTGTTTQKYFGHVKPCMCVQFSPDSNMFVSASSNGDVFLWDTETGIRKKSLGNGVHAVFTCCFSPCGNFVLEGGGDKELRLWDTATGDCNKLLKGHTDPVMACAFSPCGKEAVSGSRDETARIWNLISGTTLRVLRGNAFGVHSCCYQPQGNIVVTGGYDEKICLWNPTTGAQITSLNGHEGWIRTVCISGDGTFLISGGSDRAVNMWLLKLDAPDIAVQAQACYT